MTRRVIDGAAELRVWPAVDPTGPPARVISDDDPTDGSIAAAEFTHTTGPTRDHGSVELSDPGAEYRDAGAIGINSRVEFHAQLLGQASLTRHFTGLAKTVEPRLEADRGQILRLELEDWVSGILGDRTVATGFRDQQVSGTSASIINTIVSENAPDVGLDLDTITETRSARWDYDNLLEAVQEVADLVGAVIGTDGTDLLVRDRSGFQPALHLDEHDVVLPISLPTEKKGYANRVIVRGGRGTRTTQTQTAVDAYTTVTDSARVTTQISYNYSEIPSIDVWTRLNPGSADDLTVRIQPDDGGSPESISDRQADLGRDTVDDLTNEGWTTFEVGAAGAPSTAWIIVEASDTGGQDVGFQDSDSSGTWDAGEPVAYQLRQSYPTTVFDTDGSERDARGLVEKRVPAENVSQATAAQDLASSVLARSSTPPQQGEFEADSVDAHLRAPLDAIRLDDLPYLNAPSERYIVTRKELTFEANQLTTTFQTKRLASI